MKWYNRQFGSGVRVFFEADDGGGGGGGGEPTPKTFTQERVNTLLADQKRELKGKMTELTNANKELTTNSALTADEKKTLSLRVDELEGEMLTKEEKATKALNEVNTKLATTTETLTGERDGWRQRFFNAEIEKEIVTASTENNAFSVDQIKDLIQHKVQVVEKDGEHSFEVGEKSITEHIKGMKEDVDKFGNLFKSEKTGGQGNKAPDNRVTDISKTSIADIRKSLRK